MKKLKRIAAAFTAVLMILSTVTVVNAVTVEKDGKKYTLKYKSPSTGDVNILMLRVGFADYDIDGGTGTKADDSRTQRRNFAFLF